MIGAGLQLNDSKPQGPVQWQVVPGALLMEFNKISWPSQMTMLVGVGIAVGEASTVTFIGSDGADWQPFRSTTT